MFLPVQSILRSFKCVDFEYVQPRSGGHEKHDRERTRVAQKGHSEEVATEASSARACLDPQLEQEGAQ